MNSSLLLEKRGKAVKPNIFSFRASATEAAAQGRNGESEASRSAGSEANGTTHNALLCDINSKMNKNTSL